VIKTTEIVIGGKKFFVGWRQKIRKGLVVWYWTPIHRYDCPKTKSKRKVKL
jgi:hypothetical protein